MEAVVTFSSKSLFCFIQEKDITLSGEHVREGLTCVISVKVPNPEFEGQTKVLCLALCTWIDFLGHQQFSSWLKIETFASLFFLWLIAYHSATYIIIGRQG